MSQEDDPVKAGKLMQGCEHGATRSQGEAIADLGMAVERRAQLLVRLRGWRLRRCWVATYALLGGPGGTSLPPWSRSTR